MSTSQSEIVPSLNLVESFEYTDNSAGTLKGVGTGSNTAAGQANWIFYDKPEDIFAKKDARLYGTVMYPGSTFAGKPLQILAGTYTWNATTNKYDKQESGPGTVSQALMVRLPTSKIYRIPDFIYGNIWMLRRAHLLLQLAAMCGG